MHLLAAYLIFHALCFSFLMVVVWKRIYHENRFEPVFEVDCKRTHLYQKDGSAQCLLYTLDAFVLAPALCAKIIFTKKGLCHF